MPKKKINSSTRNLEAKDFYSDFSKNDMLYAVLVRSPAATGKVVSVNIPDLPENYYLFTAQDIPGSKKVDINKSSVRIFGYDNILYNGEPLGILCGPNEEKLQELLETVSVNFDVKSLESALNKAIKRQKRPIALAEANRKNDDTSAELSDFVSSLNDLPSLDNVIDNTHDEENIEKTLAHKEIKTGLFKELELSEAEAQLFPEETTSEEWKINLNVPGWTETAGACCYTEGKKVIIHAPCAWTSSAMEIISKVLDLPAENIYIHKTKISGFYSTGIWRNSVLSAQVALASYLSKKPVKLVLSQEEQDAFMLPAPDTTFTYKTAVTEDGKITAMAIDISVDAGACNPFAQEIAERLSLAACNYYKPENLYINTRVFTSKNPPTSICLNSVENQAIFAIENQIQTISNQKGIFPEDIRKINSISKNSSFPISIPSEELFPTYEQAVKISDFNRKYAAFNMDAIDRLRKNSNPFFALPLRGIGISTGFNYAGYNGTTAFTNNPKVEVTLVSPEKVIIHAIKPSDYVANIWKETAAEILQINKKAVTINSEYPLEDIPDCPDNSFNSIATVNDLIKKCCNDIQKKRFHQGLPITAKKSQGLSTKKLWDKDTFSGIPYNNLSYITAIVEIELDTYTYNEKIKGIWISINCGELLDPVSAKKAVLLEVQQELSMLVEGKTFYCDNISINFVPTKSKSVSAGNLVHKVLPAAFSSALSSALATQLNQLPCTEKHIFELIRDREIESTVRGNE